MDTEFVNLPFSQQNAFIGFQGVTSRFGLPINQLGVVRFTCAPQEINENNTSISDDGVTVNGGGSINTAD